MQALNDTAADALRSLLAAQPLSAAKVGFAWRIAAGPTMAGATAITWSRDGRVRVRTESEAWRREVAHARPVILERMRHLLGPDAVTSIVLVD